MVKDLIIGTQYMENYGAHGWTGVGDCPQFWKAKGGEEIIITHVPESVNISKVVDMVRSELEWSTQYSQQWITGFGLEECGVETQFEREQQQYQGKIEFPTKRIAYSDLILEVV